MEGVWQVATSEFFSAKIIQANKKDLKTFSSEGLKSYEKKFHLMLSLNHTEEKDISLEFVPMKT